MRHCDVTEPPNLGPASMASAEKTQPMQDEALKWLDGRDDYGGRHFLSKAEDRVAIARTHALPTSPG